MATEQSSSEYHYLYKLLLIGDSGVGKSCLLQRFADSKYEDSATSTIGVDFKVRTIHLDGKTVKLQIWDSAGQERYRTVASAYYRGAQGVGIVFDLTDENSFENILFWLDEIENHDGESVRKLLIGNKCDLEEKRLISAEKAEEFASQYEMSYIETSAKTAENVAEAFTTVTRDIFHAGPASRLSLTSHNPDIVHVIRDNEDTVLTGENKGCC